MPIEPSVLAIHSENKLEKVMPRKIQRRVAATMGHTMIHRTWVWNKSRKARDSASTTRGMKLSRTIYFDPPSNFPRQTFHDKLRPGDGKITRYRSCSRDRSHKQMSCTILSFPIFHYTLPRRLSVRTHTYPPAQNGQCTLRQPCLPSVRRLPSHSVPKHL